jgi:hypothetical protein
MPERHRLNGGAPVIVQVRKAQIWLQSLQVRLRKVHNRRFSANLMPGPAIRTMLAILAAIDHTALHHN